jgi:hypothetical protein
MGVSADDFALGNQLRLTLSRSGVLTAQQFLAIVNDIAGSDIELISIFKLLSSHPAFLGSFATDSALRMTQSMAVLSYARESLSPQLLSRLQHFIDGFNHDSSSASGPVFDPPLRRDYSCEPTMVADDFASTSEEPATLFADTPSTPPKSPGASAVSEKQPQASARPSSILLSSLKPILLIGALVVSVFCLFKVQALCEPLGLCESTSEDKGDDVKPAPKAPPSDSVPSGTPQQPSQTAPPSAPSPPYTPPSGPANRDEPLW